MSTDTEPTMADDATDVDALGRELGEVIAELPEYQAFEEAQDAVKRDDDAQRKIQEFEELRHQFMLARQTGEASQEDVAELQAKQQELHNIPIMADFLAAQEELVNRLESINEAISAPLAIDFGEEAGGCCQD